MGQLVKSYTKIKATNCALCGVIGVILWPVCNSRIHTMDVCITIIPANMHRGTSEAQLMKDATHAGRG